MDGHGRFTTPKNLLENIEHMKVFHQHYMVGISDGEREHVGRGAGRDDSCRPVHIWHWEWLDCWSAHQMYIHVTWYWVIVEAMERMLQANYKLWMHAKRIITEGQLRFAWVWEWLNSADCGTSCSPEMRPRVWYFGGPRTPGPKALKLNWTIQWNMSHQVMNVA